MKDIEEFIQSTAQNVLSFEQLNLKNKQYRPLENDALFHLPLIALAILIVARGKRPVNSQELGQLLGECFELCLPGFKGSAQLIGWSANLRYRTAKALSFLEATACVEVSTAEPRRIKTTDKGRRLLADAMSRDRDLEIVLYSVEREFSNEKREQDLRLHGL